MKKARIFLLLIIIFLISVFGFLFSRSRVTKLIVGQKTLNIEIADTPEKKSQGLSDRRSLCSDCGLLFIYDQPGIYSFWMRRMYFDIDIIWIRDKKVVEITAGAKAPSLEEFEAPKITYQSKELVDIVLEVSSGWTEKNKIEPGTEIVFPY